MATYLYRCTTCNQRLSVDFMLPEDEASHCQEHDVKRDYRGEGVGIAIANLKQEREHSYEERAAGMLPSNKDYMSASDPDGTKGIREWRETHHPAADNKKPYWPGTVEKKSF